VRELVYLPDLVQRAADARDPSRIAAYLEGLAGAVHAWYHPSRPDAGPADDRHGPAIARAARTVLANALTLLGLEAPERI
jgi:arginyl-tRNA synthetase